MKSIGSRVKDETYANMEKEAKEKDTTVYKLINEILADRYKLKIEIDKCVALNEIDDEYWCIWGRKGKTPNIKQLKDKSFCNQCNTTLKLVEKVEQLERELTEDKIMDFPICLGGAELKEEDDRLMFQCMNPEYGAYKWRDVQDFCKVRRNGANCEGLRWNRITVKSNLEEKDNR